MYHRSGDATIGTHGNSGLWRPIDFSHRVALVFYQTDLKGQAKLQDMTLGKDEQV